MAKRNNNVKACPNADQWMQGHPDAARNLRRIIKFMDVRYEGANQGYINRAENFAEYRFDPVEGERHFRLVLLYARQKHLVVRFTLFARRRGSSLGKIKTLKNASGNDYYVLEFAATADNSLDELEALGVNSVEINKYGLPVRASKWFSRRSSRDAERFGRLAEALLLRNEYESPEFKELVHRLSPEQNA